MVWLWLHLAIIQFGRELLSSHQIIENPKKQVDKHGVKHAEPQNFQCLIDRRIASRISMNTTSGCLAFKSSCFCLLVRLSQSYAFPLYCHLILLFFLPCPLSRALSNAPIGLGSSTVHKLTSNGKMKNKKIWYNSTAIACNMNYGSTHYVLFNMFKLE